MLALDMLHKAQLEDPRYDPAPAIERAIKSALLSLADALALLDGNPDRAEYAKSLVELHQDDDDPFTAMAVTAATWLRDARMGGATEEQP